MLIMFFIYQIQSIIDWRLLVTLTPYKFLLWHHKDFYTLPIPAWTMFFLQEFRVIHPLRISKYVHNQHIQKSKSVIPWSSLTFSHFYGYILNSFHLPLNLLFSVFADKGIHESNQVCSLFFCLRDIQPPQRETST